MGVVQDPMTFVALKEQIHKKCNGYEEFCGNFKKVKKKIFDPHWNQCEECFSTHIKT